MNIARGKAKELTGDSLVCCFHGSTTPGGGHSKYSPGCTYVGGINGLMESSSHQCTTSGSSEMVTNADEDSSCGRDEARAFSAMDFGVFEGAPDGASATQFYTKTPCVLGGHGTTFRPHHQAWTFGRGTQNCGTSNHVFLLPWARSAMDDLDDGQSKRKCCK